MTNTGPPPATEEQLINLPLVKIGDEEIAKNMECSICMEDFKINEEAKKLPCKHYFHVPCITEWLKLVSQLKKKFIRLKFFHLVILLAWYVSGM